MSEQAKKPDTEFKTQEEIKLKVSDDSREELKSLAENCDDVNVTEGSHERTTEYGSDGATENRTEGAIPGGTEDSGNGGTLEPKQCTPVNSSFFESKEHSTPGLNSSISYQRSSTSGLKRHNTIVAVCAVVSCSFLGFSAVDLKFLIEKPAIVSDTLTITSIKNKPELPPGFMYVNDSYSSYDSDSQESNLDDQNNTDQLRLVMKQGWNGRRLGFADNVGKIVIPPQFLSAGDFNSGLAPAMVEKGEVSLYGYIDSTGQFKIPPSFENGREFRNGAAPVMKGGKFGLIDTAGKYILKPTFSEINQSGANFSVRTSRDKYGLLSPTGKWLLPTDYAGIRPLRSEQSVDTFPDNLLRNLYNLEERTFESVFEVTTWNDHLKGLVDGRGKWLLPPKFEEILSYESGIASVVVDGKIGFANSKGDFVIKPQFDQSTPYADLIAVRNYAQPWRFIDKTGNFVAGANIDDIITERSGKWLNEGLAPFVLNGKVGYLNSLGEIAIKPQYDIGFPFVKNYAPVWSDGCWRFIDKSGNLQPLRIQSLSRFFNGRAIGQIPGIFYPLVEFSSLKSIRENIASWMKNARDRQPSPPVSDLSER